MTKHVSKQQAAAVLAKMGPQVTDGRGESSLAMAVLMQAVRDSLADQIVQPVDELFLDWFNISESTYVSTLLDEGCSICE